MISDKKVNIDRLKRYLNPRHIAVLGGSWSETVVRKIKEMEFNGPIWPISSTREKLGGVTCLKSLSELPEAPDAVFIGINRDATIDVVEELNQMGAGGAMCFASGFAEVGDEGEVLQDRLVAAAGEMPIEGPNCYGMLNYLDGVAMWPDEHGCGRVDKGVAILCQSGNIALTMTMHQRSLPIAYMITLGNQAKLGVAEFIEAMLDDPRITAIGILIEGIKDIHAFSQIAIRALKKGVPIVVIKSGRTEAGAAITVSHTSTLSGLDENYAALFERLGIYRCFSLPGFMEALKFLNFAGTLRGNRVLSLSCSGGEAAMVADTVTDMNLDFADFTDIQRKAIRATLNELVSISNPFDYHTFIWGNRHAMEATFTEAMRSRYDVTILLMDFPKLGVCDTSLWDVATQAYFSASEATSSLCVIVSTLHEGLPEKEREKLINNGVLPMQGLDDCLHAIECAAWIGKCQRQVEEGEIPVAVAGIEGNGESIKTFNEWESKQTLKGYGLSVPEGYLVSNGDALSAADRLGYPVAVKAIGEDLVHKTEVGGVSLHLFNANEVSKSVDKMAHLSDQFIVERMFSDAIAELIIGVKRDPQFGPVLLVGTGGVYVELLQDSNTLLFPIKRDQAIAAVKNLKIARLLHGYRGRPPGDIEAAVDAIMAVASYVEMNRNVLYELDVNPLLVFEEGAIAVDAIIRIFEYDM